MCLFAPDHPTGGGVGGENQSLPTVRSKQRAEPGFSASFKPPIQRNLGHAKPGIQWKIQWYLCPATTTLQHASSGFVWNDCRVPLFTGWERETLEFTTRVRCCTPHHLRSDQSADEKGQTLHGTGTFACVGVVSGANVGIRYH